MTVTVKVKVKIPIRKSGDLTKFGYGVKMAAGVRHAALLGAVRAHGRNKVIWKLNALGILNKNRNPRASEIFRRDMRWVQKLTFSSYSSCPSCPFWETATAKATEKAKATGR